MKTTISPFLFELNGLITVLLPQDESFHLLMDLLRFNFQNKKMVNLHFWLGHCSGYCTMKINILRFSILREMEINFFYFCYSVVFLYKVSFKGMSCNQIFQCQIFQILLQCIVFIYYVIKLFWWVSSYVPYVFNSLKKVFESSVCISSVPSLNTELHWLCSFFLYWPFP